MLSMKMMLRELPKKKVDAECRISCGNFNYVSDLYRCKQVKYDGPGIAATCVHDGLHVNRLPPIATNYSSMVHY